MVKRILKEKDKVIKKIVKKVTETVAEIKAKYNNYGTCIACQGGKVECLHNNLTATNGGGLSCITCGLKVK